MKLKNNIRSQSRCRCSGFFFNSTRVRREFALQKNRRLSTESEAEERTEKVSQTQRD